MSMTCTDVAGLLGAFVDSELSPEVQLEVARHAGHCARCDAAARDLLAVRDAVVADTSRLMEDVDLSRVWDGVDAAITRIDGREAWRRRAAARRGTVAPRRVRIWGSIAAIAAGVAIFVGTPALQQTLRVAGTTPAAPVRVAAKRLPNHVYIDRLAGKDIALRREPKSGTTMIWVNHEVERSEW